jgi:hypothetical protein
VKIKKNSSAEKTVCENLEISVYFGGKIGGGKNAFRIFLCRFNLSCCAFRAEFFPGEK